MFATSCLLAAALLLAPISQSPVSAQSQAPMQKVDPETRADIGKLLEVTGAAALGQQVATALVGPLMDNLRSSQPDIPERALTIVKEEMQAELKNAFEAPGGLMEQMVEIYASHFTREEIRALLVFYSSDVGRKVVSAMPAVMNDSMKAGQEWGVRVTPRLQRAIAERLKSEGFIK